MIAGWFFSRGMAGAGKEAAKEMKGGISGFGNSLKIGISMIACAMVISATLAHGDKNENAFLIVFVIGIFSIAYITCCGLRGMSG